VKEDFLDQVLEKADDDKEQFNDQVVLDFPFGFLFAGYDTMSITITMVVKYLMETPRALHELREESEEILRRKRRNVRTCQESVGQLHSRRSGSISYS